MTMHRFKTRHHVQWSFEAGPVTGHISKVQTQTTEYKGHSRQASPTALQYESHSDKAEPVTMHKKSVLSRAK